MKTLADSIDALYAAFSDVPKPLGGRLRSGLSLALLLLLLRRVEF